MSTSQRSKHKLLLCTVPVHDNKVTFMIQQAAVTNAFAHHKPDSTQSSHAKTRLSFKGVKLFGQQANSGAVCTRTHVNPPVAPVQLYTDYCSLHYQQCTATAKAAGHVHAWQLAFVCKYLGVHPSRSYCTKPQPAFPCSRRINVNLQLPSCVPSHRCCCFRTG